MNKITKRNKNIRVYPTELTTQSLGRLQIRCVTPNMFPVEGATVRISSPARPDVVLEELTTDVSGITPQVELPAPPIDYSLALRMCSPIQNITSIPCSPIILL